MGDAAGAAAAAGAETGAGVGAAFSSGPVYGVGFMSHASLPLFVTNFHR